VEKSEGKWKMSIVAPFVVECESRVFGKAKEE
jgi:hypothetical protein